IRLTYNQESKLLLVKLMPSVLHEVAHRELGREIENAARNMKLPRYALMSVGSGRFKPRGNSKEGDTCYIPEARSENWSWPSLVLEARVSESLPQLRNDARWWFSNSGGDVKIVILILIIVEKWEMFPAEPTRRSTRNSPAQTPTMMHVVQLQDFGSNQPSASEALTLDFKKIFLRDAVPPKSPNENSNIEIGSRTLEEWATMLRLYIE
ncbi:hypothetical protein V8E54_009366, partial [Elaphomyces granulatus]